jgi:hypothetical protein
MNQANRCCGKMCVVIEAVHGMLAVVRRAFATAWIDKLNSVRR